MATYSNNTTLKVNTQNTLSVNVNGVLGSAVNTTIITTAANQYYEVNFSIRILNFPTIASPANASVLINGIAMITFISPNGTINSGITFQNKFILGPSSTLSIQIPNVANSNQVSLNWSHHATMFINTP